MLPPIGLLHTSRGLAPKTSFWRDAQFDTTRLAFIKVAAQVTETATRIKWLCRHPHKDSLILLTTTATLTLTRHNIARFST